MLQEEKRALHVKLRRAALGEHLREERGSKEAATQTEPGPPEEAMSPMAFRPQLSAQTPRQRAESVLQIQSQACDMPSAFHTYIAFDLHSLQVFPLTKSWLRAAHSDLKVFSHRLCRFPTSAILEPYSQ